MTVLFRHIGVSLARGFFTVFLILLAIFSLIVFVDEIDEVGKGQYTFFKASEFLMLTMPNRIVFLAPFIALLGSIMALGGLANGREILAMQAGGISPFQITLAVLTHGLVFITAVLLMEQFLMPPLDQRAYFERGRALSESRTYQSKQGFWFKDGHRFVRVQKVLYGEIPSGIDIFEFDKEGRMVRYLHAHEAAMDNSGQWVLKDVEKKIIDGQRVFKEHLDRLEWDSPIRQGEMRLLTLPTSSLSTSDLYHYVQVLKRKGQNSFRFELAFWEKVFRPLNTALMILVSLPFFFGPLRTSTVGKKIFTGAMAGLGYYVAAQVIERLSGMFGVPPFWTVAAPFVALLGVTLLFWKQQIFRGFGLTGAVGRSGRG